MNTNRATKTCDRCGASGLRWVQSKAGNWYLSEGPRELVGDYAPIMKVIYPAHDCDREIEAQREWDEAQRNQQLKELRERISNEVFAPLTARTDKRDMAAEFTAAMAEIERRFALESEAI